MNMNGALFHNSALARLYWPGQPGLMRWLLYKATSDKPAFSSEGHVMYRYQRFCNDFYEVYSILSVFRISYVIIYCLLRLFVLYIPVVLEKYGNTH